MVQAAGVTVQECTVTISVVMCNTGGTLCALHRREGASAVSATVAHEKAAASVGCRRPRSTMTADVTVLQADPQNPL